LSNDHDRDEPDRAIFWEAVGNAFRPYAGWIFYGCGALLVVIGYFGISGEAIVAKQLPYLISGGIGGILLAVLGAYFLGTEELRRDGGRLDRIEKQVEELHRALLERTDAPSPELAAAAGANGHSRDTSVVVVESGDSYHRAGCALVTGKTVTTFAPDATERGGLRPCTLCEPPGAA
jgi:hypothetical protein